MSLLLSVKNIKICAYTLEISVNIHVILSGNTLYRRKSPHLARFNASELSDPISHWGDRVSIIVKKITPGFYLRAGSGVFYPLVCTSGPDNFFSTGPLVQTNGLKTPDPTTFSRAIMISCGGMIDDLSLVALKC